MPLHFFHSSLDNLVIYLTSAHFPFKTVQKKLKGLLFQLKTYWMGYIFFFLQQLNWGELPIIWQCTNWSLKVWNFIEFRARLKISHFFLFRWEAEIVGVSRNFEVWHPSAEIVHARHMCEFIIKSTHNWKFQTFGGGRVSYEIVQFIRQ